MAEAAVGPDEPALAAEKAATMDIDMRPHDQHPYTLLPFMPDTLPDAALEPICLHVDATRRLPRLEQLMLQTA